MIVRAGDSVDAQPVQMEGASGVRMRMLIGQDDGAPNFAMRQFVVEPGGHTPYHHHPYEHEVYVLQGEGIVKENDIEKPIRAGDCIFVPSDELHQFVNTGSTPLQFICLVPHLNQC